MKSCCPYCAIRDAKKESPFPLSGLYALGCPICAAHLVLSARPSRLQQESMIAAITNHRNGLSRDAVLAAVKDAQSES
jgi:hypothetical protein